MPDPDHDRIDEQGGGEMPPVRQKGGNEDIGHAGQEVRLRQHFMVIRDPVEQGRLAEKDEEGKDGIGKGRLVKNGIQTTQDQPV